jgi:hypothetical protein
MSKPKISDEMREKLRADFPKEAYATHPTKTFLTTLKAMYVTERLNDVFGVGRWTVDMTIISKDKDYILMQGEFESLDYEVIVPMQYGGHTLGSKNTELADGYKSAITDCISKIASYLEIGLDMFKGKIKCDENGAKKETSKVGMPTQSGVITEKQKKYIIDVSNKSGYTKDEALKVISKLGYKEFKEILKQDFNTLLEEMKVDADMWRTAQESRGSVDKSWKDAENA